ncbi:MAG: hypothetical protein GX275_08990 [Clostridiales bacterium]|nr:hypothetical protein [Clostridiales bacterium]
MKKGFKLISVMLIIFGGVFLSGCSSSDGALAKCLEKTKKANSMEANLISMITAKGQKVELKMNIKVEDIKKNTKYQASMTTLGKQIDFYIAKNNESYTMYVKDKNGNYVTQSVSLSDIEGMNATESFEAYIDLIDTNPEMFTDKGNNTYELNVPKDKVSEIFKKITGKSSTNISESLIVTFVIGDDGYLKNVDLETVGMSAKTEYLNYNKDFNIVIPN